MHSCCTACKAAAQSNVIAATIIVQVPWWGPHGPKGRMGL